MAKNGSQNYASPDHFIVPRFIDFVDQTSIGLSYRDVSKSRITELV